MNSLNHDAIALQAHQLWHDRGCPVGCDNEIWLEAEWQMGGRRPDDSFTACVVTDIVAENAAENPG